jgi:hypothetical protein
MAADGSGHQDMRCGLSQRIQRLWRSVSSLARYLLKPVRTTTVLAIRFRRFRDDV